MRKSRFAAGDRKEVYVWQVVDEGSDTKIIRL